MTQRHIRLAQLEAALELRPERPDRVLAVFKEAIGDLTYAVAQSDFDAYAPPRSDLLFLVEHLISRVQPRVETHMVTGWCTRAHCDDHPDYNCDIDDCECPCHD